MVFRHTVNFHWIYYSDRGPYMNDFVTGHPKDRNNSFLFPALRLRRFTSRVDLGASEIRQKKPGFSKILGRR